MKPHGCQKVHPACTHGARFPTSALSADTFRPLAGHRHPSAARKSVPRVHAGQGFRRGRGRRKAKELGRAGVTLPAPGAAGVVATGARCERSGGAGHRRRAEAPPTFVQVASLAVAVAATSMAEDSRCVHTRREFPAIPPQPRTKLAAKARCGHSHRAPLARPGTPVARRRGRRREPMAQATSEVLTSGSDCHGSIVDAKSQVRAGFTQMRIPKEEEATASLPSQTPASKRTDASPQRLGPAGSRHPLTAVGMGSGLGAAPLSPAHDGTRKARDASRSWLVSRACHLRVSPTAGRS